MPREHYGFARWWIVTLVFDKETIASFPDGSEAIGLTFFSVSQRSSYLRTFALSNLFMHHTSSRSQLKVLARPERGTFWGRLLSRCTKRLYPADSSSSSLSVRSSSTLG